MIYSTIVLACFIANSVAASLPRIVLGEIGPDGNRKFVEETTKREVLLHGVNAIVKGIPWVPSESFDIDTSLSTEDFLQLKELGVNVIRLGVMWPGVEPERGVYNTTYLDQTQRIIENAAKHGIYTLLDMHQDVMSEKFCGEGVPGWAANVDAVSSEHGFPVPLADPFTAASTIDGFPTRQDCAHFNWPQYYNTRAASYAFQALYTNVDGLRDAWSAFWVEVATRLHSLPSVLGYELINEPWAGDIFAEPKLYVPSVADRELLSPAYDVLATAIRTVDPSALIFFAAVTWDDPIPAGFANPPGGAEFSDRSVFAYHYYNPPQFVADIYFHTRIKDARRLHTASMLTEFERPQVNDEWENDPFSKAAEVADSRLQSWTMWEFKTFCKETPESLASDCQNAAFGSCKTGYGEHLIWNDSGELNLNACRKLARTYPRRVSGATRTMTFNSSSADFVLVFAPDASLAEPTEVFANLALNYPLGVEVGVHPVGALLHTVVAAENTVKLWPNKALYPDLNGREVIVTIKNQAPSA